MKKTLITLTALAMASVAQAAVLDFNDVSPWLNPGTGKYEVSFAGNSTDAITLTGVTTATDNSITNGTYTLSFNGPLFGGHDGGSTGYTNGVLKGATINFGSDGRLNISQSQNLNLRDQQLTFTGVQSFIEYTNDASLVGTTAVRYRTLIESNSANTTIWNCDNTTGVASAVFTSSDGLITSSYAGIDKSETDLKNLGAGSYSVVRWGANGEWAGTDGAVLRYVVKYVAAVPEPATATLSLLALAGLAARRRRK